MTKNFRAKSTVLSRKALSATLALALAVGALALPVTAAAEGSANCGPTTDQYGTTIDQVECPSTSNGLGDPVGPLPFTGFDVIAMLAVALAVTGLGLVLQRAVSRQTN